MESESTGFVILALLIVLLIVLYILPSIVSAARTTRNTAGIIILNLLLGWTLLGWVGALVWAAIDPVKPGYPRREPEPVLSWDGRRIYPQKDGKGPLER